MMGPMSETKSDGGRTRVMIVDDHPLWLEALSAELTSGGFEVVAVATGPDALTAFDDGGADLVLLDLMLPGLSGTEVCRELRARSNVPVIMLNNLFPYQSIAIIQDIHHGHA